MQSSEWKYQSYFKKNAALLKAIHILGMFTIIIPVLQCPAVEVKEQENYAQLYNGQESHSVTTCGEHTQKMCNLKVLSLCVLTQI